MSNNNRGEQRDNKQQQNIYQQHRPQYQPRQRNDQPTYQSHPLPPYFAGPHYPPPFPHYYPPNMKDDTMRGHYCQQPIPSPYFYGQYPPYPIPYPNYQQPPMNCPPPQHPQSKPPRNYEERGYEQRQERNYERKGNQQQRDDRNYEQKTQRNLEARQERMYQQKQKSYDNKRNSYDRGYQSRNDKAYEQKDKKTYSPRVERARKEQLEDQHKNRQESEEYSQQDSSSSDSQSEEIIYRRKIIARRKDPVLDSKQEIRKWIEARKRNYPKPNPCPEQAQARVQQSQMSLLEKKIRKKILLINADPKSMMKKLKDIDILRRFMLYSRRPKRNMAYTPRIQFHQSQSKNQSQQERQALPLIREEPVEIEPAKVISEPSLDPMIKSDRLLVEEEGEEAVEQPIKDETKLIEQVRQREYGRREQLSVDVIIKHLQMKQGEDAKTLESLMDYKSNSFHYRYQHQTLETNLLLENIFSETSYILQAIRFIVKNNFFEPQSQ